MELIVPVVAGLILAAALLATVCWWIETRAPSNQGVSQPSRSPRSRKAVVDRPAQPVPLFRIRGLTKTYGHGDHAVTALDNTSFSIGPEVTAIVGGNGTGKTSLQNVLTGLDKPTSGTILYLKRQMDFDDASALNDFRLHIPAIINQSRNLFRDLTAEENVAFAIERYGERHRFAIDVARQQLAVVGIDLKTARRLPRQLSGGQQQRVAIARALLACGVGGARVIFADEPTGAIDSQSAIQVFELLLDQARSQRCPLVVITHDPSLASRADRTLVIEHGKVHELH